MEVLERALTQWPEEHHNRIVAAVQSQGDLLGQHAGGWCLFPASRADHWVVATTNSEGERRARETVEAFVGPMTGSLPIGGRSANESEPAEAWLAAQGAVGFLEIVPGETGEELLPAIELLVTVRSKQPPVNRNVVEPIQFLMRELYLAFHNRNAEASRDLLRRVEATGRLSERNLRFLRVERLARLEQWNELEQLQEFDSLAVVQRPRRISEHLLEAIWYARLSSGDVSEPAAVRNRFQEQDIATAYPLLLAAVDVPSLLGARCVVALFCQEVNDPNRLVRVLASATQSEGDFLRRLVGSRHSDQLEQETVTPTDLGDDPVAACHTAYSNCDYQKVVDIAEEHRDRTECLPLAVRVAAESGDRELCSRVAHLVVEVGSAQLPEAEQFRLLLERVIQIAGDHCTGWVDWMERIAGDERWAMGADVVRDCHKVWDLGELLVGSMPERAAEHLIEGISGVNGDQLRNALGTLCDLCADLVQHPATSPIQTAILLLLADDENPSEQVRDAFLELSATRLDGAGAATYDSLLETAEGIWDKVKSPQALSWALEFSDQLVDFPSPDSTTRKGFIEQIVLFTFELGGRFTYLDRDWLSQLCQEADIQTELPSVTEAPEELTSESLWGRLAGKEVGLYTLDMRVAHRFKTRLTRLCPTVTVTLNDDHGATHELSTLAERSDYMIVCWQRAKHPATDCINSVRGKERQILPEGRAGLSSLVRCLEKEIQAELVLQPV